MNNQNTNKKYSITEVKLIIESSSDCKLLSKEYKNNKTKLELECLCGDSFSVGLSNFLNGQHLCNKCSKEEVTKKQRFNLKDVKTFIEVESKSGCILLSEEYKSVDSKIQIKCRCGNIFETTFYKFEKRYKRKCNICSNRPKLTYEDVKNFIEILSGSDCKLLSKEYKNNNTKMDFVCPCGEEFSTTLDKFKNGKQQCNKCSKTHRWTFEEVKKFINEQGFELLSKKFINASTNLSFMCKFKHEFETTFNNFHRGTRCLKCHLIHNTRENHPNWKGGITPLHNYLRRKLTQWKNDSLLNSDYKCVITGGNFDDIHHLYGFDLILQSVIIETSLDIRSEISNYSENELILLENKCLEIHYRYPLGVCLREDVHKLFHDLYGYGNNTPEQFEEFKQRYWNGEFKEVILI